MSGKSEPPVNPSNGQTTVDKPSTVKPSAVGEHPQSDAGESDGRSVSEGVMTT